MFHINSKGFLWVFFVVVTIDEKEIQLQKKVPKHVIVKRKHEIKMQQTAGENI